MSWVRLKFTSFPLYFSVCNEPTSISLNSTNGRRIFYWLQVQSSRASKNYLLFKHSWSWLKNFSLFSPKRKHAFWHKNFQKIICIHFHFRNELRRHLNHPAWRHRSRSARFKVQTTVLTWSSVLQSSRLESCSASDCIDMALKSQPRRWY